MLPFTQIDEGLYRASCTPRGSWALARCFLHHRSVCWHCWDWKMLLKCSRTHRANCLQLLLDRSRWKCDAQSIPGEEWMRSMDGTKPLWSHPDNLISIILGLTYPDNPHFMGFVIFKSFLACTVRSKVCLEIKGSCSHIYLAVPMEPECPPYSSWTCSYQCQTGEMRVFEFWPQVRHFSC